MSCSTRHNSACCIPSSSHRHGLTDTYCTSALSSLSHIHLWQLAVFSLVTMPCIVIFSFMTHTHMCPSLRHIPLHQGLVVFYHTCPTLGCIPLHSGYTTGCSNKLFTCSNLVETGHLSHSEMQLSMRHSPVCPLSVSGLLAPYFCMPIYLMHSLSYYSTIVLWYLIYKYIFFPLSFF
jgi:hypothetical protein